MALQRTLIQEPVDHPREHGRASEPEYELQIQEFRHRIFRIQGKRFALQLLIPPDHRYGFPRDRRCYRCRRDYYPDHQSQLSILFHPIIPAFGIGVDLDISHQACQRECEQDQDRQRSR